MATLYEIANDFKFLLDLLDTETPEEQDESITEAMEHSQLSLEVKTEAVVMMMRELEARADARLKEAEFHKRRAEVAANSARRLKDYLHEVMRSIDQLELAAGRFTVNRVRNGGRPPVDFDAALLPERFREVKEVVSWDYEAARKEALGNPDVEWAHIGERGEHIRIK